MAEDAERGEQGRQQDPDTTWADSGTLSPCLAFMDL